MKQDSKKYPPTEVISAFGCKGTPKPLDGGEGRSFRIENYVLKPVENIALYEWCADLLQRLRVFDIRFSAPIATRDGHFVHNGWGASLYEPGSHRNGDWKEKLRVGRSFHEAMNQVVAKPIPDRDDRWSQAHEIVWGRMEIPSEMDVKIQRTLGDIISRFKEVDYDEHVIHSDLCGNIMFHECSPPLVIDFSPAIGPQAYGEAILVSDAIAWEGAPTGLVSLLPDTEYYRQMFYRAVAFRTIVAGLFYADKFDRFMEEYLAFSPIINLLEGQGSQQTGAGNSD